MPALLAALPAIFAPVGVSSLSVGFGVALEFGLPTFIAGGAIVTGGALGNIALALALSAGANLLFRPSLPKAPRPEDGKYNLRQNIPSLSVIYGRDKKAGDYDLLEEKDGIAYHIIVHAGHRIEGYVEHWLHDELVTLDGSGVVTDPAHFDEKVTIKTRLGEDASTAYSEVVSGLPPGIWTDDHRGDGLATIMMMVESVSPQAHQKTFPQQMPSHSPVIDGKRLYDPRSETSAFSTNIALMRLDHLINPYGVKLALADLRIADWINAANVCDEEITNKQDETEERYHGGFWFRYENDPVEIGRIMDQAAEMVLYEDDDGKVGVHAGEYVEPDIRLTANEMLRVEFDANRSIASTVLAVRGRFKDPAKGYNMVDAAIYGDPYVGDGTERTHTVDNVAVQSHNHIQRMQKLAFTRANAPVVKVVAHYEPAADIFSRRFVKIHYPPRLDEAVVEIVGRPKLSLRNLTVEFDGIVVSEDLYDFDPETDEGDPPAEIEAVEPEDVPVPTNFDVEIEVVSAGGGSAIVATASWDHVNDSFIYELEFWTDELPKRLTALSEAGDDEVQTPPLLDNQEYHFRLRTWSSGVSSDWTSQLDRTAIIDAVAPSSVFGAAVVSNNPTEATLTWSNPGSANLASVRIYRHTADDFGASTRIATVAASPNSPGGYVNISLEAGTYYYWLVATNGSGVEATEVATGSVGVIGPELVTNGTFAADTDWTKGTGWSIAAGVASKTSGNTQTLSQAIDIDAGASYRVIFTVTAITGGNVRPRLQGGTADEGTNRSAPGEYTETITDTGTNTHIGFRGDTSFAGSIDGVSVRKLP